MRNFLSKKNINFFTFSAGFSVFSLFIITFAPEFLEGLDENPIGQDVIVQNYFIMFCRFFQKKLSFSLVGADLGFAIGHDPKMRHER